MVQPHQPGCNLRILSHESGWWHHCCQHQREGWMSCGQLSALPMTPATVPSGHPSASQAARGMSYVCHSLPVPRSPSAGLGRASQAVPCSPQLGLPAAGGSAHGGGGFSSFRALRMLRVLRSLKLLREIKGLNRLLTLVLKASSIPFGCRTACAAPAAGWPGSLQGEHQQCHQHMSIAEHADLGELVAVYADPGQLAAVQCSLDAASNVVIPLPTSLLLVGGPRVPVRKTSSPTNTMLLLSCRVSEPSRT